MNVLDLEIEWDTHGALISSLARNSLICACLEDNAEISGSQGKKKNGTLVGKCSTHTPRWRQTRIRVSAQEKTETREGTVFVLGRLGAGLTGKLKR